MSIIWIHLLHCQLLVSLSHSANDNLISTAAQLANRAYQHHFITSIIWWRSDPDYVISFLKKYEGVVILTPLKSGNNSNIREYTKKVEYKQSVFFATGPEEFQYFVGLLNLDLIDPIRLVVVMTNTMNDSTLQSITKTAWYNDFADIAIVNAQGEEVTASTYFPYTNKSCDDTTPIPLDDTDAVFPSKLDNFYGCKIKTSLLQMIPYVKLTFQNGSVTSISGIDGDVLLMIRERLNATLDIVSARESGDIGSYVNGTATGTIADVVNRRADILLPAAILDDVRYSLAQISHVFETVDLHWYGPSQQEASDLIRVIQPLMSHVTTALLTSFLMFVVAITVISHYGLHRAPTSFSAIFQAFVLFLGQVIRFETRSPLMNGLFALWIWFCLIVRTVYQGDLYHGMQRIYMENPLDDFETVVQQMEWYGGVEIYKEYYNDTPYFDDFRVLPFDKLSSYLKGLTTGKRYLIMSSQLVAKEAAPSAQMLSKAIGRVPMCFYMRPGWPAADKVDRLLSQLQEAGLISKIYKSNIHEWTKDIDNSAGRDALPLNMETLSGCFVGLGVLYLFCTCVLIAEIIYYKMTKKTEKSTNIRFGNINRYY